jgi:hypothetical protein
MDSRDLKMRGKPPSLHLGIGDWLIDREPHPNGRSISVRGCESGKPDSRAVAPTLGCEEITGRSGLFMSSSILSNDRPFDNPQPWLIQTVSLSLSFSLSLFNNKLPHRLASVLNRNKCRN